ncbi:MAG: APC family permease [Verrucomicrobiota bacterium]|nr:APC family permease [Verrucomicrobiota bacterium]
MRIKHLLLGKPRDVRDPHLFHKISLIAILAWVGLGADGLSSSCYGPEEMFKALGSNHHLALFVALASVITIAAICASYSQTIALFPTGGGGYLVASKLLSPAMGVVSGSALLVDYVLTITISIASGADALFSILPAQWLQWKLVVAFAGVIGLTLLNARGVKESVMLWVPVFFLFVATHAFAIVWAIGSHASGLGAVATETAQEVHTMSASVGMFGLIALLLRAYSLGAGTFTGIEAVSNGLPILREPRVHTGRVTMVYMGTSLAVTVAGLLVAYLLFHVEPVEGKTLNAVLFGKLTAGWPATVGSGFVWITLASEAVLLFIAAQAGFLDGPRVLANMALDRWLPTRFTNLSDRLVTQNGIVLMGVAAVLMMWLTAGSVDALVILYSINVFITFSLSQLGMVVHWWQERRREPQWGRKLAINGFGFGLTSFILISLTVIKFFEGAWITVVVTGVLIAAAFAIRRHYNGVTVQLQRLNTIVDAAEVETTSRQPAAMTPDPKARTAILLVNGFNGLGLHTALHVPRMFGNTFRNFAFISVGAVDAGNFKGADEIETLRTHANREADRYAAWARAHGYGAATFTAIGNDVMGQVMRLAREAREQFPNSVFFAGQLLFAKETWVNRLLHNSTAFTLQRQFFLTNLPFVLLPIRVGE